LKRVRCQGDQPFTYTINYLPMEIGTKITAEALYKKPLLKILEQDMGIQFTEAVQTIEASFSNPEIAENLSVANGSPILFVERIMYGPKRKPIELFQCSYRGDMYRFIVRLKNIRGKGGNKWIQREIEP
jgi:GntR family transcriptional regulator